MSASPESTGWRKFARRRMECHSYTRSQSSQTEPSRWYRWEAGLRGCRPRCSWLDVTD